MTITLDGSPYSLEETGQWAVDKVAKLERRVGLLRDDGRLNEQTLRAYFGDTRFEQIAESNAIEGSTLSVGETELAIMQGVTITGHDPSHSCGRCRTQPERESGSETILQRPALPS